MEIVSQVQHGTVVNLLCPFISTLRNMANSKPQKIEYTANEDGDITIKDRFVFQRRIYEMLIPTLLDRAKKLLKDIFLSDNLNDWLMFLDVHNPLCMQDWRKLQCFVCSKLDKTTKVALSSLTLVSPVD